MKQIVAVRNAFTIIANGLVVGFALTTIWTLWFGDLDVYIIAVHLAGTFAMLWLIKGGAKRMLIGYTFPWFEGYEYMVVKDGNVEWVGNMSQEAAVIRLNSMNVVRHKSWPKGYMVYRQMPSNIGMGVMRNMQSVPESMKSEFVRRYASDGSGWQKPEDRNSIRFTENYALVSPDNTIRSVSANDLINGSIEKMIV